MATLFGCPATDPFAPHSIAAKIGRDFAVVARQVVLGEKVDHQTGAGCLAEALLLRSPVLALEHARKSDPFAPRHVLVREPLLGNRQMPIELGLDDRLEFAKKVLGTDIISKGGHIFTLSDLPGYSYSARGQMPTNGRETSQGSHPDPGHRDARLLP